MPSYDTVSGQRTLLASPFCEKDLRVSLLAIQDSMRYLLKKILNCRVYFEDSVPTTDLVLARTKDRQRDNLLFFCNQKAITTIPASKVTFSYRSSNQSVIL
jgi:hydrogenase maturation factor